MSTIRPLDYTHAAEASSNPRRHSFSARPLDYIHVPKTPPRESSSSTARPLNYILAPAACSSQPPQARRKSSLSARPLDYIHRPEQPARRHSAPSTAQLLDYTHIREPHFRESPSSAARTLNYTRHSYNDFVRRDPKSGSLDYMSRGKTSEEAPQSAGKWSSSKVRPLDYTQFPDRSQTDRTRRTASLPRARAIDYTASPPPVRRVSSASKVRALNFIHNNGNSELVANVRSRSSLSNIRMIPDKEDYNYPDQHDYTVAPIDSP